MPPYPQSAIRSANGKRIYSDCLHVGHELNIILSMQKTDSASRLDQLDFRALRLLSILLETASVTRTAEALGMSQPAGSRSVERLRQVLNDPLLIRTRRGYVLSARAQSLRPLVADAMAAVTRAFAPEIFDPASTIGTFRIATTDYGAVTMLSGVMTQVAKEAPRACIAVEPFGTETFDALEQGGLDMALYADSDLPPDFHYRTLFKDSYACLMRHGHPLAGSGTNIVKALSNWPRAVILYPDGHQLLADDIFARSFDNTGSGNGKTVGDETGHVALRTPYFMSAPWAIAASDLVMCVPTQVAQRVAAITALDVVALPPEMGDFTYRLIWHERSHRDPGQRWLRSLFRPV